MRMSRHRLCWVWPVGNGFPSYKNQSNELPPAEDPRLNSPPWTSKIIPIHLHPFIMLSERVTSYSEVRILFPMPHLPSILVRVHRC